MSIENNLLTSLRIMLRRDNLQKAQIEQEIEKSREDLVSKLMHVQPGEFVEITRIHKKGPHSVIAEKYVGNKSEFKRKMLGHFQGATKALRISQRIEVRITD